MVNHIKLDDPGINEADKAAVLEVLDSGWLVNGPRVRQLEAALTEITGRKHAVAVSSGTTALLAALSSLGVGPGSKVVVPAFTFPAPASAAKFLGAEVLVCDVDADTFCLTPKTLEPVLDDSVSLVIAVDQFGVPAPVPEIEEMLAGRSAKVLVDAACSIGSTLDGTQCGAMGEVATFSFHPRKIVTTGEGGAVLTDDDALAKRLRHVVNHGIGKTGFESIGINLRMSEMAAAVGRSQLSRLSEIIEHRGDLAHIYDGLPVTRQRTPEGATVNHQTYAGVLGRARGPAPTQGDRDDLISYLKAQGIEASIAGYCLGSVPEVANRLGIDASATPVAKRLHERGFALPLHTEMNDDDAKRVATHMSEWLAKNGAL